MRSWLKAFGDSLGIDPKLTAEISKLASATNRHRDLEVYAAWLDAQKPKRALHQVQLHKKHVHHQLERARKKSIRHIDHEWPTADNHICHALKNISATKVNSPSFQEIHAVLIEQVEELSGQLDSIAATKDGKTKEKRLHKCRIDIKRMHYLLDPFKSCNRQCRRSVADLKRLQDELGYFHDLTVFNDTLEPENARLRPLLQAAKKQQQQQFKRLQKLLLKPPMPWLQRVKSAIASLADDQNRPAAGKSQCSSTGQSGAAGSQLGRRKKEVKSK